MDLRKFLAMSPEEQEKLWEANRGRFLSPETLQAFRKAPEQESWSPEYYGEGVIVPGKETIVVSRCCTIKDKLIKQLKDEEDAVIFYSHLSGEIADIGKEIGLADELMKISDEELGHYLKLRGIVDILTEQCGCNRTTPPLPFRA